MNKVLIKSWSSGDFEVAGTIILSFSGNVPVSIDLKYGQSANIAEAISDLQIYEYKNINENYDRSK